MKFLSLQIKISLSLFIASILFLIGVPGKAQTDSLQKVKLTFCSKFSEAKDFTIFQTEEYVVTANQNVLRNYIKKDKDPWKLKVLFKKCIDKNILSVWKESSEPEKFLLEHFAAENVLNSSCPLVNRQNHQQVFELDSQKYSDVGTAGKEYFVGKTKVFKVVEIVY